MSGIFGFVNLCRTLHSDRGTLTPDGSPNTFPKDSDDWWVSPSGFVGLYRPLMAQSERTRALAYEGSLVEGVADDEATWATVLLGGRSYAYWDGEVLTLARDSVGQYSIFIREEPGVLWFSSQLESLLSNTARNSFDLDSALHFLAFGSAPAGRTLAENVVSLPAGWKAVCRPGQPLLRSRYFTPLSSNAVKVPTESERVRIALAIDTSIGHALPGASAILLSGGVDSSYIAQTIADLGLASSFVAYTVSFGLGSELDEVIAARAMAERTGFQHQEVLLTADDAIAICNELLDRAIPCSTWTSITNQQLMTRIKGDGHRAVLSGLGSDEVFGGYFEYLEAYRRLRNYFEASTTSAPIDPFDLVLTSASRSQELLFAGVPRFFDDAALKAALSDELSDWSYSWYLQSFYRESRQLKHQAHLFEMMVAQECHQRIPELLLANFSHLGAESNLEVRYPFLTPEVMTRACGLGAGERFHLVDGVWHSKKLFREIASKKLNARILFAPPRSYHAPLFQWMQTPRFRNYVIGRTRASSLWGAGVIREEFLDDLEARMLKALTRTREAAYYYIGQYWALLALGSWYDRFITGRLGIGRKT